MGGISLRARERELKIMQLLSMNLSFRQIGAQLGISHVAAWKRYW
jgi:DNA-binding CsgD family transcriptional regulator